MDTLRYSTHKLFVDVSISDILELLSGSNPSAALSKETLLSAYWKNKFNESNNRYSIDELAAMWDFLSSNCLVEDNKDMTSIHAAYLLGHVAKMILKENQYEPLCKFENLLRWQDISLYMGEDVFTTAFLAAKDAVSNRPRDYYTWSAITRTDNFRLRQLLQKGVAENHFHLKGSANHVFLNWISAMNNPLRARKKLDKVILAENKSSVNSKLMEELRDIIYVAAKIRQYIHSKVQNDWEETGDYIRFGELQDDKLGVHKLSTDIDVAARLSAHTHQDAKGNNRYLDYAIEKNIPATDANEFSVYRGERKLLYEWQKRIYSNNTANADRLYLADLLYLYQLVYVKFRSTFIQNDGAMGFAGFDSYDKRKELFIKDTHYEAVRDYLALTGNRLHQNITQFETRITPKSSTHEMKKAVNGFKANSTLQYYDYDSIDSYLKRLDGKTDICKQDTASNNSEHFHVLHFIKDKDKTCKLSSCIKPRHAKLRQKIKTQAMALARLRESYTDIKTKILGIDTANSEFAARPEVFAQCYRFLSKHLPQRSPLDLSGEFAPQLRLTFHAGEDFYDVVDGLRTIDEAIEFCGLSRGDRIGHALAMGIDASAYYQSRPKVIYLPKQILLDNIVWMLMHCKIFDIDIKLQFEKLLVDKYSELFCDIYSANKVPDVRIYYKAYQLRCDDPSMYLTDEYQQDRRNAINFWQRCALDSRDELKAIRRDNEAVELLKQYQFCYEARHNGESSEKFEISPEYKFVVTKLQQKMQDKVNSIGIGIEANPTSNRLISKFGQYCEHPIVRWYNLGLTYDKDALDSCPQLFVSINTDDQGVFNTCLENEYALIVLALQKDVNPDGTRKYSDAYIYDWVERIRNNGIEQSFLQLKR